MREENYPIIETREYKKKPVYLQQSWIKNRINGKVLIGYEIILCFKLSVTKSNRLIDLFKKYKKVRLMPVKEKNKIDKIYTNEV